MHLISIHAPRTGSDETLLVVKSEKGDFNPRSPHGERQPSGHADGIDAVSISIHAPRTGSDHTIQRGSYGTGYFNPRSPHGERRTCRRRALRQSARFQSTLPARGATKYCRSRTAYWHISIHAPRTGSDGKPLSDGNRHGISIHAPRTGSDGFIVGTIAYIDISIHAPRTGSDVLRHARKGGTVDFNPRSPHGERRERRPRGGTIIVISIHAPRTGSDVRVGNSYCQIPISIHAPRTGSDFYAVLFPLLIPISIHAPRTGSDAAHVGIYIGNGISIHAPRTGSDGIVMPQGRTRGDFNPRSPHGERRGAELW